LYEEEKGDIELAFVGDFLASRRLAVHREEGFLGLAEVLRGADVSFANAETLFHNYESSPIPEAGPYGTYAVCDPATIEDLKWLGVDMVATANNHCVDYGEGGVVTNLENLERHGLPHAGTGRTLSEAVAPAYLDTPKGSVALVAVTITMPPADHRPGEPRGPIKGRAGANVLRHEIRCEVPVEVGDSLRAMGASLGLGRYYRETGDDIELFGHHYEVGTEFQKRLVVNEFDRDLNLNAIAGARKLADWVVVSMHNHEAGASPDEPSTLAEEFARACIDAGADVVFGHGPHRDRGVEIYRGRPIIYALGDFVLHNDLIKWQPWDLVQRYGLDPNVSTADIYDFRSGNDTRGMAAEHLNYQSAIVVAKFKAHELDQIEIRPIDLGFTTGKRSMRGRPVLAEGAVAEEVLERFRTLSKTYGTTVDCDNGRGVIRVSGSIGSYEVNGLFTDEGVVGV